jgi:S1-C subfamily serine protease
MLATGRVVGVVAGLVLAGGLAAGVALELFPHVSARDDAIELKPGKPFRGELHRVTLPAQDFELTIPAGVLAWRVKVVCPGADVDLYAGAGEEPDDPTEATSYRSEGDTGVETIMVDRLSEPAIQPGPYWIHLACVDTDVFGNGKPSSPRIEYTLTLELFASRVDAVLAPSTPLASALDPNTGGFRSFQVNVPEGAHALRVDLTGAESDLDLYAQRGLPMLTLANVALRARHGYGCETLVIDAASRPSLAPGLWYVDVLDSVSAQTRIPFEIRVRFDEQAPPELLAIPSLVPQHPERPLSRALCAVVEIFGDYGSGSGTLLSPDGLILTNAHVVARPDDLPVDEVVIALSLDPRHPSRELFRGRVAEFDHERDFALVEPTRGFYGQPIPAGYRFPTVELGDPDALSIGDPLWVIGYPGLGGVGSRVSIHCATGIVSGFDRLDIGVVLTTDAQVLPGNSGGAAVDAAGRLIAVPSSNSWDEAGGLIGYLHPLSLVPAAWVARVHASESR